MHSNSARMLLGPPIIISKNVMNFIKPMIFVYLYIQSFRKISLNLRNHQILDEIIFSHCINSNPSFLLYNRHKAWAYSFSVQHCPCHVRFKTLREAISPFPQSTSVLRIKFSYGPSHMDSCTSTNCFSVINSSKCTKLNILQIGIYKLGRLIVFLSMTLHISYIIIRLFKWR